MLGVAVGRSRRDWTVMTALVRQDLPEFVVRLPWLLIHLAAAGCIFLWLATRLMGHMQNRKVKHPLLYILGVAMFAVGLFSGFFAGGWPWTVVPVSVLIAAGVFEARHAAYRRRHRDPPLSSTSMLDRLRRPIGSVRPSILRYRIELPSWRGRKFAVLHISDIHIGKRFPTEWFAGSVRQLSVLGPDLVFLTGDTVDRECDIERSAEILRPLASLAPSYAVLGNHDFWIGADRVADSLRRAGFVVLRNETRPVEVAGGSLLLNGCEEPWNEAPWTPPPRSNAPLFVLSHTADGFSRFLSAGAAAVFSGHYHAGQVRVPVLGPLLMPSVDGRRFDHGHFVVGGAHVFISAGLGTEYPPPRILCTPDVFDVEVVGGEIGTGAH